METIQSIDIFQYIQSYLHPFDYLQWMNTSQILFQDVKKETILYCLQMKKIIGTPKLSYLTKMIQNVKDVKKQIDLILIDIPLKDLCSLSLFSSHLHSVTIHFRGYTRDKNFDFSIFNNIPVVDLKGFHGVQCIAGGFKNVEDLRIEIWELKDISVLKEINTLRRLEFYSCHHIRNYPPQIEDSEEQRLLSVSSCSHLIFEAHGTNGTNNVIDMNRLFTRHLQVFHIGYETKTTSSYYAIRFAPRSSSLYQNYKEIQCFDPIYPSSFLGKELSLRRFNLSSWSDTIQFPSLLKLYLNDFFMNPHHPSLPRMDQLKELSLTANISIHFIPTFPQLISLSISDLFQLHEIHRLPRLKKLYVYGCPRLIDVTHLEGLVLRQVSFFSCENLMDVSAIRNSHQIRVDNCAKVSKVSFDDNPPLHDHDHLLRHRAELIKRTIVLKVINVPIELSSLSHLYSLTLESLRNQDNLNEIRIHSIHSLTIAHCPTYSSTANLSSIYKQLQISSCPNLRDLQNLQGIERIALCSLSNIQTISGLGKNKQVYVYEVPFLEDAARIYVTDKKNGKEEENPYHSIFSTIDQLILVKNNSVNDVFVSQNLSSFWEHVGDYWETILWGEKKVVVTQNDDEDHEEQGGGEEEEEEYHEVDGEGYLDDDGADL